MEQAVGLSDIGCVRSKNEDRWEILAESRCYLLADGMGGHPAGEVAAALTLDLCKKYLVSGWDRGNYPVERLREIIIQVNDELQVVIKQEPDLAGMGTTLCILAFVNGRAVCGHVGDSRIYRLRSELLEPLTRDDSLENALLAAGRENEARKASEQHSNVVMQAMGASPLVDPTISIIDVDPGDLFLLCSDGLTDMVDEQEIEAMLCARATLEKRAKRLIQAACTAGGNDNVTVLLIEAKGDK